LNGKQLATLNLRPQICRKAGAQIVGKELIGGERQLSEVKKGLQDWLVESPDIALEMNLKPIVDQISESFSPSRKR
ncbi:MAG TPA: hypothetical protein VMW87_14845, partial [Spirochaetia bacterium]|nr:hypothetical protein [Spirochaetia bacterium]